MEQGGCRHKRQRLGLTDDARNDDPGRWKRDRLHPPPDNASVERDNALHRMHAGAERVLGKQNPATAVDENARSSCGKLSGVQGHEGLRIGEPSSGTCDTIREGESLSVHYNKVNPKLLPDGRTCIHWFIECEDGLIVSQGKEELRRMCGQPTSIRGKIACNPKQTTVQTRIVDGVAYPCVRTEELEAVTCPACLETKEAIEKKRPDAIAAEGQKQE